MNNDKQSDNSFRNLGINQALLDYLDKAKFATPTPIQYKAIPMALEGKDLVGIAQTGTGKTLAFGIPMVQLLSQQRGIGLVLVPTRELALQVEETLFRVSKPFRMNTAVLIGGASMHRQIQDLRRNPRILVCTPGRLNDHIKQGTVLLFDVRMLVLDEADRMLDMGFAPQIDAILKKLPDKRQTMLFSATMPPNIVKIATKYMQLPISIEMAPQGKTADNIAQEVFIIRRDHKKDLLLKLLKQYQGTVLIFTRTKRGARDLARKLNQSGQRAEEIHSDRTLGQRRRALDGFKSGRHRILVATDIASRGIDVNNIQLVVNFDLPDESENYVHRIGRTARAGKEGRAISLATPDQGKNIKQIERLIRMEIQVSQHPEILSEKFESAHSGNFKAYGSGGSYKPRSKFSGGFSRRRKFKTK